MFPKLKTRRNHNKKLLNACTPFEPASPTYIEGTKGNIRELIDPSFDNINGKFQYVGGLFKGKPFYEKVSAPYLLARLVASYPNLSILTEGQDGYKVTWTVALKHKATNAIVTFYDWKGAASIGSNILPALAESLEYSDFKRDFIALVKAIADPRYPHPYDGCVIGEIA